MKKLVALLLTAAMLLGMISSAAFAADAAASIPSATAKVDASGNVTITLSNGVTDYYAYAGIRDKDTSSTYYIDLEYDSAKKAYVGKSESAAGGSVSYASFSKSEYKYNDDHTKEDYKHNNLYYNFNTDEKITYKSVGETTGSEKQVKSEYTDSEGNKHETTVWVTTNEKSDQTTQNYNSESGKLSSEHHSVTEMTGDEKGRASTTTSESKSYYYDSAKLSRVSESVTERKETAEKTKWGGFNYNTESEKTTEKGTNYKEDGTVSGTFETKSEGTYTYDTAKGTRTFVRTGNTKNYDKTGALKTTEKNDFTEVYKKASGEDWYQFDHSESNSSTYNLDGVLISSSTYKNENNKYSRKNSSYAPESGKLTYESTYSRDDKKGTYTDTSKRYNAYTGAMTYSYTSVETRDEQGNYHTTSTQIYNNDDGTLRSKSIRNSDGNQVYYNKDNKVVASRDKDGTWTDGSGKLIGKNDYDYETGNGQYTYVSFKSRTGELDSYTVETDTNKDGVRTEVRTVYENGKSKEAYKYVYKADTYEVYRDGVLRSSSKGNETKSYDMKGNLVSSSKYDPETETTTYYDYQGKVTGSEKNDDEGRTGHYDKNGKLQYSTGYEDGEQVWYDASGKEFARTYWNKTDPKTEERVTQEYSWYNSSPLNGEVNKTASKTVDQENGSITTYKYSKWYIDDGKKGDAYSRTEENKYVWDDDGSQSTTTVDGVVTRESEGTNNQYGNQVKYVTRYYDRYTGQPTDTYKNYYSGITNDPISYRTRYDKYGNLQDYSVLDNTDSWNWYRTYYANGEKKGESWEDTLDYDNSYNVQYRINGNKYSESTFDGELRTYISYNRDNSYSYWREEKDGVTNSWDYNKFGQLTGYRLNETSDDNGTYYYEWYDASGALQYRYSSGSATGYWMETYSDDAGNKLVSDDEGITLTLANKGNGWQSAFGSWFYIENGKPVTNEWKQDGGNWYYFDWNGMMVTGVVDYYDEAGNDTVYITDKKGVLATGGWTEKADGVWTYTKANGEPVTGWQQIGGKWYYFDDGWYFDNWSDYKEEGGWIENAWSKGVMATGATKIWDSTWTKQHTYFFNEDGTWDTTPGWKVTDGQEMDVEYHYYDGNGKEVTGWQQIGGDWFYFNDDGVMKTGWVGAGDGWYFMDQASGAMTTGWACEQYDDTWYYFGNDGKMLKGWQKIDGEWYYLKSDGAMAKDEWAQSGSAWYYMKDDGTMATGWQKDTKSNWYYLGDDGTMKTGWQQLSGSWYYLGDDGVMRTGEVTIDGKVYTFDDNGVCQNP